jgi:serine phosphatase RsbU (regulator of sigma subunit)/HD-like signal output (HDOD) protein
METATSRTFVADLVSRVGSLPSVAAQVVSLASDPGCDIGSLARVIMSDNAMSMRFLALANAAAVSHGRETRNLRAALLKLGLRRVRNVALLMGMHDMVPSGNNGNWLDSGEFWKFNLATASCAQGLAWLRGSQHHEDAWLAGILHAIGLAAMSQRAGPEMLRAAEMARAAGMPLAEAEMRVFDFHHGEVGGRLLREWHLPALFADAVEYLPEEFDAGELSAETAGLVSLLRESVMTVRAIGFGDNGDGDEPCLPEELAARLGLAEPAMQALADKVDRELQETSRLIGLDVPADHFASTLAKSQEEVARLGLAGLDETMAREDLEQQMNAAREIQQRLLPRSLPELPGYRVAAVNVPSLHISGDTYDCLRMSDGAVALAIADVSGKGMPAALLAGTLQASLRALSRVTDDPGELLEAANGALFESTDPERFATLFLAVLGPDGTGLRYASAGHNPPLVLRADGRVQWLKPAGTPLGMIPDMTYPVFAVAIGPGDLVVAYTDGVTEAMTPEGDEFGETGLEAVVRACAAGGPQAVVDGLLEAIALHIRRSGEESAADRLLGSAAIPPGLASAGDDITLIVFARDA